MLRSYPSRSAHLKMPPTENSDLSEEEMRRALFDDAERAPLVTPPLVPEATAELVFEKPKASLQTKMVAKAFTPRLQVTLMVGNEYEGKS